MKLSAQALKDRAKNTAEKFKSIVTIQEIIQNYMFERFLERLSLSKYHTNLVLKGRTTSFFYCWNRF